MPIRSLAHATKRDVATGAAAIAHSLAPIDKVNGPHFSIRSVTLHLAGNPTTSEVYSITRNDKNGAAYDVPFYKEDLSIGTVVDVVVNFKEDELVLTSGDSLDVAYANTETNTYGSTIEYESF